MPLTRTIEALRAMRAPMQQMAGIQGDAGYFRPCRLGERVKDALNEASERGSILAFKGDATCIMPVLIDGWTRHGGMQQ